MFGIRPGAVRLVWKGDEEVASGHPVAIRAHPVILGAAGEVRNFHHPRVGVVGQRGMRPEVAVAPKHPEMGNPKPSEVEDGPFWSAIEV